MDYIRDPAEQTTAITDLILAAVALAGIFYLYGVPLKNGDFLRITIWSAAVGLIGLAAALGAAAHGLVLTQSLHQRIWQILNLALALAVALFVVGVVFDLWGKAASFKALPVMLLIGLGFCTATSIYPGIFLVFILFESLALVFALIAYAFLAWRGELASAGLIAAGILVSIIAAGIQAHKSISVTLIWQFNHNGIYHLLQVAGLILLLIGLRWSLAS